jgi:RNA polymerase sigma-70 factor (ECF subfamily)
MSSAERAATASVSSRGPLDEESREWLRCLAGPGEREQAFARLHKLLLRAARAELRRRSFAVRVEGREWDDLARNAIYKTMFDARRKSGWR